MHALVTALRPAIQAEVGFALLRAAAGDHRDPRQEALDMVQEVFACLLGHDGKILRAWDPTRGSSLATFVRLVARRHVAGVLRSKRRNPYMEPPASDTIDLRASEGTGLEPRVEVREQLAQAYERLEQRLDERGLLLFELLYVQEQSIEEVMAATGMTRDALYAWRSRLKRTVLDPLRDRAERGASDSPGSRSRGGER
jgi:RNA polymerase sigma factor (sigma-70 family)